jgi:hypothetical protein
MAAKSRKKARATTWDNYQQPELKPKVIRDSAVILQDIVTLHDQADLDDGLVRAVRAARLAPYGYRKDPDPIAMKRAECRALMEELSNALIHEAALRGVEDFVPDEETAAFRAVATRGCTAGYIRPSTWLMWAGPAPLLCQWGGFFMNPHLAVMACTPGQWLNHAGYFEAYVKQEETDLPDRVRHGVLSTIRLQKKPSFLPLWPNALDTIAEFAKDPFYDWLRQEVAQGPMNVMQLPPALMSVQDTFF